MLGDWSSADSRRTEASSRARVHHLRDHGSACRLGLGSFSSDAADQLRLRKVKLVIAAVDEDALGIKERSHSSVAEHRRMLQTFNKVQRHLLENTRRSEVSAPALAECPSGIVFLVER